MYNAKKLREHLQSGKPIIGPFVRVGDPAITEICGYAGFDYVIVDMEHGPINPFILQQICRGGDSAGIPTIARASTYEEIGKVLDVGCAGVQIPQITTKEEAAKAVEAAKFLPDGMRGVCRFVRASEYSNIPGADYFKAANETLIILMIEGKEGLDNLDEILTVKGIDIIFVGPYDLSQSLGVTGQVYHPKVEEAMIEIVGKCKAAGVAAGIFSNDIEDTKKWISRGVQYINYGVDTALFYDYCKSIVKELID